MCDDGLSTVAGATSSLKTEVLTFLLELKNHGEVTHRQASFDLHG